MKRKAAYWGLGIFLFLMLLWLAYRRRDAQGPDGRDATPPFELNAAKELTGKTAAGENPSSRSGNGPATGKMSTDERNFQDALNQINGRALALYGKVVDQDGIPVPEAVVNGAILRLTPDGDKSDIHPTTTDSSGMFSLSDLHGSRLGLNIIKSGYLYDTSQFNWNAYRPDPAHPLVFVVYKVAGAEPMLHYRFRLLIPCDGTTENIDLKRNSFSSEPKDIAVSLTRTPLHLVGGHPYEWNVTFTIPNGGGLKEIEDVYPYRAPKEGYSSQVSFGSGQGKAFSPSVERDYYYHSASGEFGRVHFVVDASFERQPQYLRIDLYLNPSGSRNLEYDITKQPY